MTRSTVIFYLAAFVVVLGLASWDLGFISIAIAMTMAIMAVNTYT
jgi:hypothetical protein